MPTPILFLLPGIVGLAVNFMHGRLSHGHSAGIARKEKVDIVDITADIHQIDACKMAAGTQICQIFRVDAHQF